MKRCIIVPIFLLAMFPFTESYGFQPGGGGSCQYSTKINSVVTGYVEALFTPGGPSTSSVGSSYSCFATVYGTSWLPGQKINDAGSRATMYCDNNTVQGYWVWTSELVISVGKWSLGVPTGGNVYQFTRGFSESCCLMSGFGS